MKFARYGEKGAEKPAIVDAKGELRDLSGLIDDISSKTVGGLAGINVDVDALPSV